MGILNVTPDSFADGGRYQDVDQAVTRGEQLVADGAAVLDIGGESTRPGHVEVPAPEQLRRVLPVLTALRTRVTVPISIDTTSAVVAAACLDAGADWVNDTTALRGDPHMASLVANRRCPLVLMHRFEPALTATSNCDVVELIIATLSERIAAARAAGIGRDQIVVDPGLGFGTRAADNLAILAGIGRLMALGLPVLVGPSRKSFLGAITGQPVDRRGYATAAVVSHLADTGVAWIRVHDVAQMADLLRVRQALRNGAPQPAKDRR